MSLLDRIKGLFNRVFNRQKELPEVTEEEKEEEIVEDIFDTYNEVDDYEFDPKIIADDSGKTKSISEMIEELDVKGRSDRKKFVQLSYNPSHDSEHGTRYTRFKEKVNESKIDIGLNDLSRVNIVNEKVNSYDEDGRQFVSKNIEMKDKYGDFVRTGNLSIGYNKEGFLLEDGEYVSHDEIMQALEKALESDETSPKMIKCKTTGKYVDTKDLKQIIAGISRGNAAFEIRDEGKDEDIGVDISSISLRDERDAFIKKGLVFLDKGNVTLPNGEYVSKKDIELALSNYLFETRDIEVAEVEAPIEQIEVEDEIPSFEEALARREVTGRHVKKDEKGNIVVEDIDPTYVPKHGHKEENPFDLEDEPETIERPEGAHNYSKAGYFPNQEEKIERPKGAHNYSKAGYFPNEEDRIERPEGAHNYSKAGYIPRRTASKKGRYESKHVKKTGKRCKIWPLVLAGVATVSLGFGINKVPKEPLDNYVANYKLTKMVETTRPESEDEVIRRINESFAIGRTIPVPDGVVVHASSDYTQEGANKSQGVIGNRSLKINGQAQIDYISLIDGNGRIVQVTYDQERDANVEEAIERAVAEKGFDRNTGRVMLHLSGVTAQGKDITIGWADQEDLISDEQRNPMQVPTKVEGEEIIGTQEGFTGSIQVPTKDGGTVTATFPQNTDYSQIEGNHYQLGQEEVVIKEFHVENQPIEQEDGIEVEWDFKNIQNRKALLALFGTLGIAGFAKVNSKKPNEKNTKDKTNEHDEEPSL